MFRTIAERATSVEFRAPTLDRVAVVAEMMRSVDKKMRTALMEKLQESDESFCANVKKQLYVFEDLNRLGDRDVQKFLGEIQTEFLIIGLQKAPEDLKTKVLSNLSSRARQSVEEEMEFKTDCKQEEIDDARAQLIEVLARLDDAGEVSLE